MAKSIHERLRSIHAAEAAIHYYVIAVVQDKAKQAGGDEAVFTYSDLTESKL